MSAIRKAEVFQLSAPGALTPFLTPFTISAGSVRARVQAALNTTGKLYLYATDGSSSAYWTLNGGSNLTAGVLYDFEFATNPAFTYNLLLEVDGVVSIALWDDLIERS
mgnify:FL=1